MPSSGSPNILITRPERQARIYADELESRGFLPLIEPALLIEPTGKIWPELGEFQVILITSVNGLLALAQATDRRDFPLYVVGPNTFNAAKEHGFEQVLTGSGTAKALAALVVDSCSPQDGPILYVRGEDVAFDMKAALRDAGFSVDEYVSYKAVPITALSARCKTALKSKEIEAITFFSVRSAEAFIQCVEAARLKPFLKGIKALCISQSVLEYVRSKSGAKTYVAETPDRDGITALIHKHCRYENNRISEGMERDIMSASKPSKKPIENGAEIIERFGGIRPLAKKIDVAVTTVQGWKKRDTIPATRREVIIEAAEAHNVDLTDLMTDAPEVTAANQNAEQTPAKPTKTETTDAPSQSKAETIASLPPVVDRPGADAPLDEETLDEKLAAVEERVVGKNTIIVIGLIALMVLALAALLWPKPKDEATLDRLSALEARTQELQGEVAEVEEKQSFFGTLIPEDLDEQLATLQQQASDTTNQVVTKAQEVSSDVMAEDAGTIGQRAIILEGHLQEITGRPVLAGMLGNVEQMSADPEGRATLDEAMAQLNAIMSRLPLEAANEDAEGQVSVFESTLNAARGQSEALGQTFDEVPASELKAAAMLLTMQQFRSSLNRDNEAFADDFEILKGLISEDNVELHQALEKLAPHAEEGVLTPSGLTNEFKTIAGDAVVASLKGEDVSIQDRAAARFNEVLQIEKDGELITGTETQAKVNTAETLLENGQIEEAISIVKSLDGPAGNALAGWLKKAQATLNAQSLSQNLTNNINMRAFGVEDVTAIISGQGAGGTLVQDKSTGINILTPSSRPAGSSGNKNSIGDANPFD